MAFHLSLALHLDSIKVRIFDFIFIWKCVAIGWGMTLEVCFSWLPAIAFWCISEQAENFRASAKKSSIVVLRYVG